MLQIIVAKGGLACIVLCMAMGCASDDVEVHEWQVDSALADMTEIRFDCDVFRSDRQMVSSQDLNVLDDLREAIRRAERTKMNTPKGSVLALGTPWQLFIIESGDVVLQMYIAPDGNWYYRDSLLKDDVQLAGDSLAEFFRRIASEDSNDD